jgi:putative ABC transport system substrate-binding protein
MHAGIAAAALMLVPGRGHAQSTKKIPQIGFLYPGPETPARSRMAAFASGVQAAGLREVDGFEMLPRLGAGGDTGRLAAQAADLVAHNVDLISAISPAPIRAAMAATRTIPIVGGDLESDPVGAGFVASVTHPGGNVTGTFLDFPNFATKWLEALKEALPRLSRVALVWDPGTGRQQLSAVQGAAGVLGIAIETIEFRRTADAEAAFAAPKPAQRVPCLCCPPP